MASNRIETALNKIEDLLGQGEKKRAYEEVRVFFENRRLGRLWTNAAEALMKRYVELCVEFRKSTELKAGLQTYKNLCQGNIQSFETALTHYVAKAEERVKEAQTKSETIQTSSEDTEMWPETLLMKAVSTEDFKDRTDRTVVSPWIKFLWDTYRNVLEYLKVSPALENKYHEVAQRTSRFCKTYKKKTELKNLTTLLKQHLTALKVQIGDTEVARVSSKVTLNNLETVNQNIETRFKHLKVAIALDLWQDAYKTIEDIHYLVELAKEGVKDQHLESYYELLARTFLVSKNFRLHACAYYKLFKFSLLRNKDESQIRSVASSLLLATLAIPSSKRSEADEQLGDITEMDFLEREKLSKMSALLGLPVASSKQDLIDELKRDNISQYVYPELRNLTNVLAGDFDPFAIGPEISKVLEFLKPSEEAKAAEQDKSLKKLRVYGKSLRTAALSLLLDQLSKVYSVIRIEELISMAPKGTTLETLERVLVDALQQRSLLVTIDHQSGVIYFNKGQATLDSETVRREMINFAKKLRVCSALVHREELAQKREARRKLLSQLTQKSEAENRALLERQQWLERKREWEGRQKIKLQEEIAARAKEEAAKRAAEEEKRRIEEEKRIQEQKQKLAEAQQKKQLAEQFVKAIEQKATPAGASKKAAVAPAVTINTDEITGEEDLVASVETIVEAQKSKIEKAKKEKEKKLAELARQYDFLERARREAEIPLLKQDYENQKKLDKKLFEDEERRLREVAVKQAEQIKQEKQRVERFGEDKAEFLKQFITPKRTALFNKKKAEQEKRRAELYADWEKRRTLIMEEIQKREEAKKKREEERRKREEERKEELRKKEEEEKKKAEQAAKQMQKQREIEERLAQQQQELASKVEKKPSSRWGSLGGESGAAPSAGTGRSYASRFGESRPMFSNSKKTEEAPKEPAPKEPEAPQRRSYVPRVGAASQAPAPAPEKKEEETEGGRGSYSGRGGYGSSRGGFSGRGGRPSSSAPPKEDVDEEGFQTVSSKPRGGRRGGR